RRAKMQLARLVLDRMRAEEIGPAPSLAFSSADDPGWRRRRHGAGFSYGDEDGARPDADDLARIKALAIPPAWTEVWISKQASVHVKVPGRDDRGRKQYRHHPDWTEHRSGTEFETLTAFAKSLPVLREQLDRDLRRHGLSYERVVPSLVWVLVNSL